MNVIIDFYPKIEVHQQALQLCARIRNELSLGMPINLIASQFQNFYTNKLEALFEYEEKHIFTKFDTWDALSQEILSDQINISFLIMQERYSLELVEKILYLLESHVYFKERVFVPQVAHSIFKDDYTNYSLRMTS